jgi:DNA-binding beta-propeller fold protein YncE
MTRREFLRRGAAFPIVVWMPRAHTRATAAVALVTADTEAHVVVAGLAHGAVRARIPTLEGPRSIERCPRGAVVAHTSEGAVTLLDDRRVRRVLRGFGKPRYTAVAPDGRLAYVTDSGTGELAVIDLERGRVIRRTAVGAHARHLGLAPGGGSVWVALGSSATAIALVDLRDPERPRVRRTVRLPLLAHDVAVSPDGRRVWVTAAHERRIAILTPRGMRLLDADAGPQHVCFGAGVAYVTSGVSGTLRVHRLGGGAPLRSAAIAGGSYNVQASRGRVLSPSLRDGTLTVLDSAGRVVAERRVAAAAPPPGPRL